MWSLVSHPGLATATLDFTNDFLWLGVGLFGLMALAASWTVLVAIHHHISQNSKPVAGTTSEHYRKAA